MGNPPVTMSCDWVMYTNLLPWLPCSLVIQKSSLSIKDDKSHDDELQSIKKLISYKDDRKVERRLLVL